MDIKNIDTDAIKISLELGLFILILWVLSHAVPIVTALPSAVEYDLPSAVGNTTHG